MTIVTATELQNNFGKYLQYVQQGQEIIILKNGKEVARLVSSDKARFFLTDSLVGVMKNDMDAKRIREERTKRYENID